MFPGGDAKLLGLGVPGMAGEATARLGDPRGRRGVQLDGRGDRLRSWGWGGVGPGPTQSGSGVPTPLPGGGFPGHQKQIGIKHNIAILTRHTPGPKMTGGYPPPPGGRDSPVESSTFKRSLFQPDKQDIDTQVR